MDVSRSRYHHPTPWDTQFEALSLPEMFARTTVRRGAAPLLHFLGREYSYAELYADAQRFASHLAARGIAKGDRVGLFLPNVPIYVAAYYGAMMAGAIVVNFSPLYTVDELSQQVADSGTRLLVTVDVPELYGTAEKVLRGSALETLVVGELAAMLPTAKRVAMKIFARSKIAKVAYGSDILRWSELVSGAGEPPKLAIDPNEVALLQYTGGTTGTPKGAMLSHANLSINAQQVCGINPFGDAENEVFMGALPMFHVFANTALLNHAVASGASIAIVPRFEAKQVLQTIGKEGATGFPGVPTMFQALLDHPDLDKTDLSSLKVCISGGAPLPAPVREKWEARTGTRLVEGYGLTESSGVVSANPYDGVRKPGTIGQVVAGTEILLLDKEDPAKLAPDGEPGELAIHGPQIMQGYWNRPEASAEVFVEHGGKRYLRTGDVAVQDEDGFLQIVDRIKDMIAVGGFKVFPSEVEKVLLEHEAVKEALVLGLPDTYRGESVNGYITLVPDAAVDAEAIKAWVNARLGKHERLETLGIRDSLPKTMIGKLDRKALKAEISGES
ncbi:long-chain fatty acid--CoA ligase [Altererythrobacter arenosus]|uniref:Long-chain fatty acid--CoA ligase n=1 Tax=Altererythrobacter arenosus TaxID=3032592 RepID=A0ABY8FVK2_9SPHN|nr:long-chain fatty acid--CoA ligase [Altererythrobacter sp. CAU 1644]WFL79029.1 long-chain fatty acid--CoA ligase [Altererythrobacter sp. CAU 1644]